MTKFIRVDWTLPASFAFDQIFIINLIRDKGAKLIRSFFIILNSNVTRLGKISAFGHKEFLGQIIFEEFLLLGKFLSKILFALGLDIVVF